MGRVSIPTIGTEWVLTRDWTFNLYAEYRNTTLFSFLGIEQPKHNYKSPRPHVEVTLPKGTKLIIDRIYIRKGLNNFDSFTFRMPGRATERTTYTYKRRRWSYAGGWEDDGEVTVPVPRKPVRFWALLGDVNQMEVDETP